jgi:hypothetical protein
LHDLTFLSFFSFLRHRRVFKEKCQIDIFSIYDLFLCVCDTCAPNVACEMVNYTSFLKRLCTYVGRRRGEGGRGIYLIITVIGNESLILIFVFYLEWARPHCQIQYLVFMLYMWVCIWRCNSWKRELIPPLICLNVGFLSFLANPFS